MGHASRHHPSTPSGARASPPPRAAAGRGALGGSPEAWPRVVLRLSSLLVLLVLIATAAHAGDEGASHWAGLQDPSNAGDATRTSAIPEDPPATGALPAGGLRARSLGGFRRDTELGGIVVRASAPTRCLPGDLKRVLADVAGRFGSVSVESTHRSRSVNRRKGGARHSLHIACRAVDFRVRTRTRGLMAYLRARSEVGGLKIYRSGIIHIDNGERRTW